MISALYLRLICSRFENGASITVRTSGTEPKIKYYSEMFGQDKEGVKKDLERLVAAFVDEVIRPDVFGFQRRE